MKKSLVITLLIMVTTGLMLGGNVNEAFAAEKQITLKFAYFAGETTSFAKNILKPWLKRVEAATNNRVKIDVYWGGALAKVKDQYDAVTSGLADMTWAITVFTPSRFLATEIVMLAFLGFPDASVPTHVLWDVYEKFPEMQKELGDVEVLIMHTGSPVQVSTSKKPVRNVKDLEGLKVRAVSGPTAGAVKRMGAVPIPMSIMDIYQSVEKGLLQGFFLDLQGIKTRRLYEVANYFTIINMSAMPFIVPINKNKWNSLPPDIQKQIMSVSGLEGSLEWSKAFDEEARECMQIIKSTPGKEVIIPSPEELQTFLDASKPSWDEYLEKLSANGIRGKEMLDEILRLSNKYK